MGLTWFAKKKDFGRYLIEDFKIRKYIKKNITNSGVSELLLRDHQKNAQFQFILQDQGSLLEKKVLILKKLKKTL